VSLLKATFGARNRFLNRNYQQSTLWKLNRVNPLRLSTVKSPPLIRNTNIAFVGQSINQPTKLINKLLNHSYCMFDSSHPALDTFFAKNKSHNTINYQIPLPLIWYRNLPQILPHGGSKASKRHVEKNDVCSYIFPRHRVPYYHLDILHEIFI